MYLYYSDVICYWNQAVGSLMTMWSTLMNFTINLVPASYQGSAVNSFEQYIDTLDSKQVNELLPLLDDAPFR